MGGAGGIMNMMKEFSSMEGMQNLAGLKRKMKGKWYDFEDKFFEDKY